NIRREPDRHIEMAIAQVVTARHYFSVHLAIIAYRTAFHYDSGISLDQLNFPHQHCRLEVALVLIEPGSAINHTEFSIFTRKFRDEHVRVYNVILTGGKRAHRLDGELAALFLIE